MRAFVAIELPDGLREQIGARMKEVRASLPSARWVDPRILHLTLVFIGEISEQLAGTLGVELRSAFRRHRGMELRLRGAGTFPPRGSARVAWLGVNGEPSLLELQEDVAGTVTGVLQRQVEDRAFHPHVTLARCKKRSPWKRYATQRFTEGLADLDARFRVSEGVLMASQLDPGGPLYSTLTQLPLAER